MNLRGLQAIFAALVVFCAMVGYGKAAMAQDNAPAQEQAKNSDAPSDDADDGPRPLQERCIPLRRVRSIKIVDARTIIWEIGGSGIDHYKMTLSNKCPGLMGRGAFVHSSSGSRLCDVGEWIRVAGGTRAICPIDRIEPWTPPEDADKDKKNKDKKSDK